MLYDAFISYSQTPDERIAAGLQTGLQRIAKPWYRFRSLHVFRDRTNLFASPSLWEAVREALLDSRFLVLLVSPESASSEWVDREVACWLEHREIQSILFVVTNADVRWDKNAGTFVTGTTPAVPPSLIGILSEEPLWVDLRAAHDGARLSHRKRPLRAALLDLAARIMQRPKEDLIGLARRQYRRNVAAVTATVVGFGVLALVLRSSQLEAGREAQFNRAQQLARESISLRTSAPYDLQAATLLAIESQRRAAELKRDSPLFAQALRSNLDLLLPPPQKIPLEAATTAILFEDSGRRLVMADRAGWLKIWDLPTRTFIRESDVDARIDGLAFDTTNSRYAIWINGLRNAHLGVFGDNFELVIQRPADSTRTLAFSPDGRYLFTAGSEINLFEAIDLQSRDQRPMQALNTVVAGRAVVAPSGTVVARVEGGTISLESLETRTRTVVADGPDAPSQLVFSDDGASLAIAYGSEVLVLSTDGSELGRMSPLDPPSAMALNAQVGLLATSRGNVARIWELPRGRELARATHDGDISRLAFSPDGSTLATGGVDAEVRLWRPRPAPPHVANPRTELHTVAFTQVGPLLADGIGTLTASLLNLADWSTIDVPEEIDSGTVEPEAGVFREAPILRAFAIHPAGTHLARATRRKVWITRAGEQTVARQMQLQHDILSLRFSPSGSRLAVATKQSVVVCETENPERYDELTAMPEHADWRELRLPGSLPSGDPGDPLRNHKVERAGLFWSADENYLWLERPDPPIRVFQLDAQKEVWAARANRLILSPPADAAVADLEGAIVVRSLSNEEQLATLPRKDIFAHLVGSPRGDYFAYFDGSAVHVYRTQGTENVASFPTSRAPIALALSEGGRWLAVLSQTDFKVLNTQVGSSIVHVSPSPPFNRIAFDSQGRFVVASGSFLLNAPGEARRRISVWELEGGSNILEDLHPEESVEAALFGEGGNLITVGPGTARYWEVGAASSTAAACRRLSRNLSFEEWRSYIGEEPYRATCDSIPLRASELLVAAMHEHDRKAADQAERFWVLAGQVALGERAAVANEVCHKGGLYGQGQQILAVCDRAVVAGDFTARRNRFLVRANAGDLQGAAQDLSAFLEMTRSQAKAEDAVDLQQLEQWLSDLNAGRNPITSAYLSALRERDGPGP